MNNNEPLEFLLDCAEDELAKTEDLIVSLINQLYQAQRNKRRLQHAITGLNYDIENQASA
jgi:hypothetical protein